MNNERGFTLVELMVVVLIIAILIAIAIPSFLGARTRAQNRAAQQMITNGAKVEFVVEADGSGFTDDVAVLAAEEPALDWTGGPADSVHVVLGDATLLGDNLQVLIYSQAGSGTWWGFRMVIRGPSEGRYYCTGGAEADVSALAGCAGASW